ncbi:MAG: hypothetical protein KKD38_10685 [Candidatus Delongbacteria bacterium]|nr:hypothetical protein [Candidatus Delongbacteria bacterium]MCG2760992.1 hypothetical protein [Candidatus Delongbacteria bacterium]
MDIQMLKDFFMWCTIIDGSVLILWTLIFTIIPNLVFKSQTWIFPTKKKEHYALIMYSFIGLFKIMFIIFNLIPYLVLLIIG